MFSFGFGFGSGERWLTADYQLVGSSGEDSSAAGQAERGPPEGAYRT
jgi:hypothetical protein